MPVTGTILVVNDDLNNSPELVNSDPYGNGWIIKITISNDSELEGLLSADDYKTLVGA